MEGFNPPSPRTSSRKAVTPWKVPGAQHSRPKVTRLTAEDPGTSGCARLTGSASPGSRHAFTVNRRWVLTSPSATTRSSCRTNPRNRQMVGTMAGNPTVIRLAPGSWDGSHESAHFHRNNRAIGFARRLLRTKSTVEPCQTNKPAGLHLAGLEKVIESFTQMAAIVLADAIYLPWKRIIRGVMAACPGSA